MYKYIYPYILERTSKLLGIPGNTPGSTHAVKSQVYGEETGYEKNNKHFQIFPN
jgi:hypothetical protein